MNRNLWKGCATGVAAMCMSFSSHAFVITLTEGAEGTVITDSTDVAPVTKSYFAGPGAEDTGISYDIAGNGPSVASQIVGLIEPGSNVVSDWIAFQGFNSTTDLYHIDVRFLSDDESGTFGQLGGPFTCAVGDNALGLPVTGCLPETGGLQTIFVGELFTIQAQSDVPEPASLALLGLGLAGLRFGRRKQT